ncbi:hypothetical protein B0T09DRAFT_266814 [Sordaria sp. MPI-SDFR-AT-0083]|nr:hypothetical protein B0T09DRAFT_266814 [Sordaria sp. MPI-SDFR-AT-0083]
MDGHGLRRRAVDLLIDDLGRVCYDLRRYLDEGETPIRKVKPPDVKAARDLFEQIITRIGHVSTKLADEQFLSSGILPEPLANGPHTPISNVDVSTIVHHQQQFVPTESVEPNQPPQQVQLEREPVQQQVQPQPEQSAQQREQPQAQQEVHLQPKLLPQQHGQQHDVWQHYQQHAQQSQLQGQQRDQLQSRHEVQLLPKLQPQQRDQQQIEQAALLQVQQENQLQPQQPVQQQVQLLLQQRDQHQGQQEVQLQPQQPLQQYNQLPDDLEDWLQGRQEPQQAVSQQEQLDGQRRILPQNQQQGQQQDQQQDQQRAQLQSQEKAHLQHQQRDQQHGKQIQQDQQNQFQYQQQENQHTEAVLEAAPECAPEAVQEAVPETVPETVADAGAGAVDREASSQPEPPAQDEIHVVGPGPRAASPTPTIHNIPTNSSTSCDTDHNVEVRPEDPAQLPPPKLLPLPKDSAPLFDCTYQDVHVLNEELFEQCSLHPDVQDRGYFKLQVRDLPPLQVGKMAKPDQTHATSFVYKKDNVGLVKVDTGKRPRMKWPEFPLTPTEKQNWSLREQKHLWNSTAAHPPSGAQPYIIGNPLFDDVELSPGDKLRRRGQTVLEGINTQYMYFNLKAKTITVMHREDAHVRSENLLRDGENKFWCFVKPSSAAKLEERMRHDFPEMRSCSQAVRHLSRHIPPAKLDEWGVEYTLDYCVPGQAVVTEPGTYHQVLNLGPNYAIAINVEYESSPDDPPNYTYCDEACPDQCAISAEDFRINPNATAMDRLALPAKTKPMAMMAQPKKSGAVSPGRHLLTNSIPTDSAPASDQQREEQHPGSGPLQQQLEDAENYHYRQPESAVPPSIPSTVSNISEVNLSVIDSGRVEGGPMQVVSEPQQVITQSEAPPEVQQAVVEVRHVAQKPEAPVEVHQATPEQEKIALLPAQPPSQPVMVEQQEEQTAMISQELHIFLRRFFKMKLSEGVHSTAQVNGLKDVSDRPVSSHIDWGELSRKLNWDVAGRNQLNDYVREGKCWRTICGEYDGLLCLLPSDDRFLELSMFKEQLAHFHAQLSTNAVRRMCAMGQILEKSIWEYLELPEFAWESVDTSELSLDDISPLLSQFKLIKTNQYNRLKYKWELQPQPLGWTDPWPSDPMSVLRSDKKVCSLCNSSKRMTTEKSSCKCLVKRLPQIPRITEDGSRGPGVRAVGSFKAGEFLGELVGELRPPQRSGAPDSSNRYHSNIPNGHTPLDNHDSKRHNYEWTMEVRRPDINDQVVAEIYPQQMGNWVRKVRHDGVNPSAIYNVMKITGKWRVMLVALRDIRDGEEITAKYGRGYRKEQPYEVVEGLH